MNAPIPSPRTSLRRRFERTLIRTGTWWGPLGGVGRWYGRRRGWQLSYGPRVLVDRPGEAIQAQMLRYGVYEPEVVSVVMAALDPGEVLIDVGGNVGQYTLIAAHRGAYSHVFEPVPRIAERLRENVAFNGLDRFVTLNVAALSDRQGSAQLYVAQRSDDGSHSLLPGVASEAVEVITAPTLRLDDYLAATGASPAVMKIDVEGAEALVLDGAAKTLEREDRPVVVLETADRLTDYIGESARSALDRLARRRYRIFHIAEGTGVFTEVDMACVGGELANYVAIPEGSPRMSRILGANGGAVRAAGTEAATIPANGTSRGRPLDWARRRGREAFRQLPMPIRYHLLGRWRSPRTYEYVSRAAAQRIHAELSKRLRAGTGPSFLFLPAQTWYSKIFQRPQQLARALASLGSPVVFVEPLWFNEDVSREEVAQRQFTGVRDVAPGLHVLRYPDEAGLRDLIRDCGPDVLLMEWPLQGRYIAPDARSRVVYEMIDDHELVPGSDGEEWQGLHRYWLQNADVMVASATDLMEICQRDRPDTILLNNAVCLEDWGAAGVPVPADLAEARRRPVVVGYYGSIASWFDMDLLEGVARLRPDWAFVVIGHAYDDLGKRHVARMRAVPNITYLPAKPYASLPGYLAHFDVATIPFLLNPVTHACSPVKLFEYMAAGKPVVATPMREILQYETLLTAEGPEAFTRELDRAVALAKDSKYRSALQEQAAANTWRARAEAMLAALEQARRDPDGRPRRLATATLTTDPADTTS